MSELSPGLQEVLCIYSTLSNKLLYIHYVHIHIILIHVIVGYCSSHMQGHG